MTFLRYNTGIMQTNTDIESLLGQILFLTPEEKDGIRAKVPNLSSEGLEALQEVLQPATVKQGDLFAAALKRDPEYRQKFLAFIEEVYGVERARFESGEVAAAEQIFDQPPA